MWSLETINNWLLPLFLNESTRLYWVEEMEALVVARALKFAFEIGVDKAFLEDVSVVNESFD